MGVPCMFTLANLNAISAVPPELLSLTLVEFELLCDSRSRSDRRTFVMSCLLP